MEEYVSLLRYLPPLGFGFRFSLNFFYGFLAPLTFILGHFFDSATTFKIDQYPYMEETPYMDIIVKSDSYAGFG